MGTSRQDWFPCSVDSEKPWFGTGSRLVTGIDCHNSPPVTMKLVFIDLRAESLLICSESSANNKPLAVSNS